MCPTEPICSMITFDIYTFNFWPGFVAPAVCMFLLSALSPTDWVSHVALLTIGMTLHEFAITGGFYFSHPDVAGPYKTVAFGITNTFAQLTGFLNPMIVAHMTPIYYAKYVANCAAEQSCGNRVRL